MKRTKQESNQLKLSVFIDNSSKYIFQVDGTFVLFVKDFNRNTTVNLKQSESILLKMMGIIFLLNNYVVMPASRKIETE